MTLRIPDNNEVSKARKKYCEKVEQYRTAESEKAFYEIVLVEKILTHIVNDLTSRKQSFPVENMEEIEKRIRKTHYQIIKICELIGYPITWAEDFYRFPKGEDNGEEE